MSDLFGDWDDDDAYDRELADPEQVTYRLHELRVEVDALAGDLDLARWDDLDAPTRQLAAALGVTIVTYLAAQGPDVDPADVARHLHEARRFVATSRLAPWDQLDADDRAIGVALMTVIVGWLTRQGAL